MIDFNSSSISGFINLPVNTPFGFTGALLTIFTLLSMGKTILICFPSIKLVVDTACIDISDQSQPLPETATTVDVCEKDKGKIMVELLKIQFCICS